VGGGAGGGGRAGGGAAAGAGQLQWRRRTRAARFHHAHSGVGALLSRAGHPLGALGAGPSRLYRGHARSVLDGAAPSGAFRGSAMRLARRQRWAPALAVLLILWAQDAFAHVQMGEAAGFLIGLLHPISGLDHVLAMVAVGLWGAQLGAPAIWVLPVAFPLVMALGGMLGLMGVPLPGIEYGIAASALLLGAAVA